MIRILHLPDLHIGHPRVKATYIRDNLMKVVYPILEKEIDLLIIGGDFFDSLLNFNSESGYIAATIIQDLKYLATNNNFLIRVLRGTFSHDRKQNQFFIINDNSEKSDDIDPIIKVYENLSVERIKKYDITLLFIPDDLPYDDISFSAKKLLSDSGYDKTDFIITHGYFDHLLPPSIPNRPSNTYKDNQFDDIVLGSVLNGHVHSPTVCGKIITGGSFERLSHGEEESKGFFKIEYDQDTHIVKYKFIENPFAALFKTVDLSLYQNGEEAIQTFTVWLDKLLETDKSPGDIYIRVISSMLAIRQAIANITHNKCKRIHVTYKKNHTEVEKVVDKFIISDLPVITEENLSIHISNNLAKQNIQLTIEEIDRILS